MIILLVVQTFKSSYKSFKLFDLHLCTELPNNSTCIFQVCVGLPVQSFLSTTLICLIPFHCFSITCSLTLIAFCCFFTVSILLNHNWATTWQNQRNECAPSEESDSLGIRPVWSQSLLCAQWVAKDPRFLHADSKTLIRLGGCPGWSESSLGAQPNCWFCHVVAQLCYNYCKHGKKYEKWDIAQQNKPMRPAKTQISLGSYKDPRILHGACEDSEQTGRICPGWSEALLCTRYFVGFVMLQLKYCCKF